jgi:hypothetical protein
MTDLFDAATGNDSTDYLALLTGPGGKFHRETPEESYKAMARGKYEADNTIEIFKRTSDQLKADNQRLTEEYNARAKLEEYIDQMNVRDPQLTSNKAPIVNEANKPLDSTQIADLVSKEMRAYETSKTRAENAKAVEHKLKERYGTSYQSFLSTKIEELGLTKEEVNSLAETSPKVLINALGLNEAPKTDPFQAPPRSTSFSPTGGQKEHTWSWYQDLKKSDPKVYNDPKTTTQMIKDYESLGSRFEDGDFKRYGDSAFG